MTSTVQPVHPRPLATLILEAAATCVVSMTCPLSRDRAATPLEPLGCAIIPACRCARRRLVVMNAGTGRKEGHGRDRVVACVE